MKENFCNFKGISNFFNMHFLKNHGTRNFFMDDLFSELAGGHQIQLKFTGRQNGKYWWLKTQAAIRRNRNMVGTIYWSICNFLSNTLVLIFYYIKPNWCFDALIIDAFSVIQYSETWIDKYCICLYTKCSWILNTK